MSLKAEASKGVLWVAVERLGQQLLQIIIFIVLARLLTPEDFGLVAMLFIFFAVAQSFIDSGLGQALIREKEITDQDRTTVFWFNLLMSVVFYGVLYMSAPYISDFYNRPELTDLTRVMGLMVIFYGIAIVQRSEMTQQLEFKKQAYAQLPAMAIAGVVSITMAYYDFGVWALAAQYLLLALMSSIFLWILQPAKIYFRWDRESFNRLFGFGYKLLLSGLINTVFDNIYKLVIGKAFTANILGYYTQARKLTEMVSNKMVIIIQKVTYPLLAKAGDDEDRLKRGYRQVIQVSSFVIFPGVLLLIELADPIITLVFGAKWAPAIPYLRILCASGILYHLHSINLNILKVLGRSDLFLKLEIIKKVNISIAIVIGLQFGIWGLLIAQVISSYIALWINTYYTAKFLNYTILEQAQDVFKVLILSIPMLVLVGLLIIFVNIENVLLLIGVLIFAGLVYIGSNFILKPEVFKIILSLITPYTKKLKQG